MHACTLLQSCYCTASYHRIASSCTSWIPWNAWLGGYASWIASLLLHTCTSRVEDVHMCIMYSCTSCTVRICSTCMLYISTATHQICPLHIPWNPWIGGGGYMVACEHYQEQCRYMLCTTLYSGMVYVEAQSRCIHILCPTLSTGLHHPPHHDAVDLMIGCMCYQLSRDMERPCSGQDYSEDHHACNTEDHACSGTNTEEMLLPVYHPSTHLGDAEMGQALAINHPCSVHR